MLCNVVDVPELCSFILPAVHRDDPIAVAISTGRRVTRARPAAARRRRPARHARARAARARAARAPAVGEEHLPTYEARRDFFRELVEERLG